MNDRVLQKSLSWWCQGIALPNFFSRSPVSTSRDNGKNTGPMQTVLLAAATRGNPSGISRAATTGAGPGDHHPEEAEKADCWRGLDLQVAASRLLVGRLAVWSDQVRKTAGHLGLRHSALAPEKDGHSSAPWYQAVIPKLGPVSFVGRRFSKHWPFLLGPSLPREQEKVCSRLSTHPYTCFHKLCTNMNS